MRLVVGMAILCLAACASEKLAQAPPAGVDFSGRWKLNEADSDDPQRLAQAQFNASTAGAGTSGGSGGSGGRGGRQGGRGSMNPGGGAAGPVMPAVTALGDSLRWPGKLLDLKQVAGVVAFSSEGYNRVCQPTDGAKHHGHHGGDRDAPLRGREAPPPICGWQDKTLIVQGGDPDDERPPFEELYSLSEDGQRLVEVVSFRGGRSNGFTLSRVWDRAAQ